MLKIIRKIIAEYVEIDTELIDEDTNIRSGIKINSYDFANIIIAIEDEFNITISERDAVKFQVIGDLLNYIENACAVNSGTNKKSYINK